MDDYYSEDEEEKTIDRKDVVGGGNMSPEVLKMLQQLMPTVRTENEEDEPDEIKANPPVYAR